MCHMILSQSHETWNIIRYSLHFKGESPWSWLRHAQNVETSYDKLGDVDLLEQPWPQLICCAFYKPHGCNFREWSYKKL